MLYGYFELLGNEQVLPVLVRTFKIGPKICLSCKLKGCGSPSVLALHQDATFSFHNVFSQKPYPI